MSERRREMTGFKEEEKTLKVHKKPAAVEMQGGGIAPLPIHNCFSRFASYLMALVGISLVFSLRLVVANLKPIHPNAIITATTKTTIRDY
jgi:hypothetical protein